MVGILTLHLLIPGCASLKEKRGRLKPLLARLHRQFNLSVAELDLQDKWQETVIACGMLGNDRVHLEQSLQAILRWLETNWQDMQLIDDKIELL
jgi:uncharacterized protein YlxP (DUF503 family)